ncbi:MAG: hypothetical protein R3305_02365 [Gammaproteobacteria bacterium]|nr:hypothetical protein [Gammaproteobacteria bacterium]
MTRSSLKHDNSNRGTSSQVVERSAKANWVAAGFLGAFILSVATIIYTGLMAGVRSLSLNVEEQGTVELVFDMPAAAVAVEFEVVLPDVVEFTGQPDQRRMRRSIDLTAGINVIPVEITGTAIGGGYVNAQVGGAEQIGTDRVFVRVRDD